MMFWLKGSCVYCSRVCHSTLQGLDNDVFKEIQDLEKASNQGNQVSGWSGSAAHMVWVVLEWCLSGTWVVLEWYLSGASVVLEWCFSGTWMVLEWCFSGTWVVLQWYLSGASVVLQWYFSGTLLPWWLFWVPW